MKKLLLFLSLLLLLTASACLKKSTNDDPQPDTIGYFTQHLKATMSYSAMVAAFGNPDSTIAGGLDVYVYNLTDGTFVRIAYSGASMAYARHVDGSGQILHTII